MYASFQREAEAMTHNNSVAPAHGFFAAVGRLVESIVAAHARQLPPSDRELPPEWFHYPIA